MTHARHALALLALVGLCLSLAACDTAPKTTDEDIEVIQYKRLIELLENPGNRSNNVFKVFSGDAKKGKTLLVDVRSPARYNAEHIPGAINITLPQIVANDPRLGAATNIVVYASGWTDVLSGAAAKRLISMQYKNVFDFRGGLELWKHEGGRTISAEAPAP